MKCWRGKMREMDMYTERERDKEMEIIGRDGSKHDRVRRETETKR